MEGTETAEHKMKYLKAKKKTRRKTVYQAKCRTERKRPGNVMWKDDQECDVFKFAKRMIKTNENIIGEQCIRNNDDVLTSVMKIRKYLGKVTSRSFLT